ncbi:MAG: hypothetical protein KAI45_00705, partial [Melioribacteraceae bacterium]|nr:hypothetical protein [Melioribacteraceae bacterium]
VEERGNSWEFCARILQFDIDTFTKSGKLFDVVTLPNGDSELRFSLSEQVVNNLFNSLSLEVFLNENNNDLIWKGDWTKKKTMKLPIKNI